MQHTVATVGGAVTAAVEPHEHLFYQGKGIQKNSFEHGWSADQSINPQPDVL